MEKKGKLKGEKKTKSTAGSSHSNKMVIRKLENLPPENKHDVKV